MSIQLEPSPDPTGGSTGQASGNASPIRQNLSWERQNPWPALNPITIYTWNADAVRFSIQFENTSIEWLSVPEFGTFGYLEQLDTVLPLNFQNLSQLSGSYYRARIWITWSKTGLADFTQLLDVILSISGVSPMAIQTDKSSYNIVYRRDTDELSGDINVQVLNNNLNENLTFSSVSDLFQTKNFTTNFTLEENNISPWSQNPALPPSGTVSVTGKVQSPSTAAHFFTIYVSVLESDSILSSKESLIFEVNKSNSEVIAQTFDLINPLNHSFIINTPSWLHLSLYEGSTSSNVIATAENYDALEDGEYNEQILVQYGSSTLSIPVVLKLTSHIKFDTLNLFCEDNNLEINKLSADAKFVRFYVSMDFVSHDGPTRNVCQYTLPYYKNSASLNIGQVVQRFFPIYSIPLSQDNQFIYAPANVHIVVEELDIDFGVLNSTDIPNVKLFPGARPKLFPLFTSFPIRSTFEGSSHIISYYTALESGLSFGFTPTNTQGNNEIQAVRLPASSIDFSNLYINRGLEFVALPAPEKKVEVQWLNKNLVPESAIFIHHLKENIDLIHRMDDFEINSKKYGVSVKRSISLNTGWLLKEEEHMITDLIESPYVYLFIDSEILQVFCTSQKLVARDSEVDMSEFTLDFKIVKLWK